MAIISGLASENPASRVLGAALVCMVACHLVGLGIGMVGERVVEGYLRQYRAARPVEGGGAPGGTEGAA